MGMDITSRVLPALVAEDVSTAIGRIEHSISMLDELSETYGSSVLRTSDAVEPSKAGRLISFERNSAAQEELVRVVRELGPGAEGVTDIERAVSRLKDANWMLARQTDASRTFSRIDFDGAIADSRDAIALLRPLTAPEAVAVAAPAPVAALDDAIAQLATDLRAGDLRPITSSVAVFDVEANAIQLVAPETWKAAHAPYPSGYAQMLANDITSGAVRAIDDSQVALLDGVTGQAQLVARSDYERALAIEPT